MSSFDAYKELLDIARTEGEKKFEAERKAKGEEIRPVSMTNVSYLSIIYAMVSSYSENRA